MAQIGKRNLLTVLHEATPGFYLDGGALGEILLPGRYRTAAIKPGAKVEVFVYRDSEDRLIATTQMPHAELDEFALLRVVSIKTGIGAFLDWGLEKDLLLPIREWKERAKTGDWILVKVRMDARSNRMVASARLDRNLDRTPVTYATGDAVKLIVAGETPLGYFVIINHAHRGLLYANDVPEPLTVGQALDGFILKLRDDQRIDVTLHQSGYERMGSIKQTILNVLPADGSFLPYHDGSTPAEIHDAFGVSKKAFKQAIGTLFRERRIVIGPTGIKRVPDQAKT